MKQMLVEIRTCRLKLGTLEAFHRA